MNIKKILILTFFSFFSLFIERPLLSMEDSSGSEHSYRSDSNYSYDSDSDGEELVLKDDEEFQLEKLVGPLANKAYNEIKKSLFTCPRLDSTDRADLRSFFIQNDQEIKRGFSNKIATVLFGRVNDSEIFARLTKKNSILGQGRRGNIAQAIGEDLLGVMSGFLRDEDWNHLIRDRVDRAAYRDTFSGLALSKLKTLIKDPRTFCQKWGDRSSTCWKKTYSTFKWASFSAISLLGAGGFLDLVTHHSVPGTASVLAAIVFLSIWRKCY